MALQVRPQHTPAAVRAFFRSFFDFGQMLPRSPTHRTYAIRIACAKAIRVETVPATPQANVLIGFELFAVGE